VHFGHRKKEKKVLICMIRGRSEETDVRLYPKGVIASFEGDFLSFHTLRGGAVESPKRKTSDCGRGILH